jgi:hypothetical protein
MAKTKDKVYDAAGNVKPYVDRALSDEKLREDVLSAFDDLRHAADRLQGKRDHSGRNTALLMTGIVVGLLFNPVTGSETRKWLKDLVGGGDSSSDHHPPASSNGA